MGLFQIRPAQTRITVDVQPQQRLLDLAHQVARAQSGPVPGIIPSGGKRARPVSYLTASSPS